MHSFSKRRGISSVIGGLIFVILLAAGLSVFSLSLDTHKNMAETQQDISAIALNKQKESFTIEPQDSDGIGEGGYLQVYVTNHGQNPLSLNSVWVTDLSTTISNRVNVDYENSFIMPNERVPIMSADQVDIVSGQTNLEIKVISKLGTIAIAKLGGISGSSDTLVSELVLVPQDVRRGGLMTAGMLVTNHGTQTVTTLEPQPLQFFNSSPGSFPVPGTLVSISPQNKPSLFPSESVLFQYHYVMSTDELEGQIQGSVTSGGPSSTTGKVNMTIGQDFGDGNDEIQLDPDRIYRPDIFVVKPNPYGKVANDEDHKGLWGVTIANPSETEISVHKVTISLLSPDKFHPLFPSTSGNCSPSGSFAASIFPVTAPLYGVDNWKCPVDNQLIWSNPTNPIVIGPYKSQTVLVALEPGSTNGNIRLDSVVVHIAAYTNIGEFGKAGYGTGVYGEANDGTVIANVYLAKNARSINYADIETVKLGIVEGTTQDFLVSLANFDDDKQILSGTVVTINLPTEWTFPGTLPADYLTDYSDFDGLGLPQQKWVGTHWQILATTDKNIVNGALTLGFKAIAPPTTVPKLQLMAVLTNGQGQVGSGTTMTVAPLGEFVLQTCPVSNPTCA